MALNANIGSLYGVKPCRVDDICLRGLFYVDGAGSVALFTANIPFRDGLGLDVLVDGVAAVAKRPCRALHVISRIERHPPV